MTARIGIDTGGTFTDVVRLDGKQATVHKLPSTPNDPSRAVAAGVAAVRKSPNEAVDLVHGTTVGLNAVLTGNFAPTVFLTNRGLEDVVEIARQDRTHLYSLAPTRTTPPVPRSHRIGIDCRRDADGAVVTPLREAELLRVVARIKQLRPQAIAIGLLHSPLAPQEERRIAAALRAHFPDLPITCSAELAPVFGEYERFTAAILNAAIAPTVSRYVAELAHSLGNGRVRLLRSSLGIMPPREAERFPARALFSGPAGGVLATEQLARAMRLPAVAAFDMGGTSADLCLVQPGGNWEARGSIAGLPLPIPTVPVHTVGCGGGSIAFVDAGGALRVGPRSAGAVPGPACYGIGDEPTVTDAHLVLGHIGADTLLGGSFPIDVDAAVAAIERLARQLGTTPLRTAQGILEVANATMARAALVVTAERAVDPIGVPLVAYGGAGGLHAAALAGHLQMPKVILPHSAGAFSALGLALAGESTVCAQSLHAGTSPRELKALAAKAKRLEQAARTALSRAARCQVEAMVRFVGQGEALPIRFGAGLAARFRAEHLRRFGFVSEADLEIVQLAARAETPPRPLPVSQAFATTTCPPVSYGMHRERIRRAPLGRKGWRVLPREAVLASRGLTGPCVLEEGTATTLVPIGWTAQAGALGLELHPPS